MSKEVTQATKNVVGTLKYMQFILTDPTVTDDMLEDKDYLADAILTNNLVRVRYNQDPTLYAAVDTTIFEYTAKETIDGVKQEVVKYAVPVADAKRAPKTAKIDNILADLANGMTPEAIALKYGKK